MSLSTTPLTADELTASGTEADAAEELLVNDNFAFLLVTSSCDITSLMIWQDQNIHFLEMIGTLEEQFFF